MRLHKLTSGVVPQSRERTAEDPAILPGRAAAAAAAADAAAAAGLPTFLSQFAGSLDEWRQLSAARLAGVHPLPTVVASHATTASAHPLWLVPVARARFVDDETISDLSDWAGQTG